jgi:hypothetical protein
LEVGELELGDRFTVRGDALPDREFQNTVDDLIDRPIDGRRNDRPYGGENRTDAIVDLVEGASGFDSGTESAGGIGGIASGQSLNVG